MSRKNPVESVSECLTVGLRHGCSPGHFNTAGTHGVHEVPNIQAAPDVLLREGFAAGAECQATFLNDFSSQGNVAGDDKVTWFAAAYDLVVRNIKTGFHLQESNVGGGWNTHPMVCNQRERETCTLRRPEQDLLDHYRTRIGIDPDLQPRHTSEAERRPMRSFERSIRPAGLVVVGLGSTLPSVP